VNLCPSILSVASKLENESWQIIEGKICTELTFPLTHHHADLTSTSREQGEQEGESRATLTLGSPWPLGLRFRMKWSHFGLLRRGPFWEPVAVISTG
jgi:hypothetical protein